MLHTQQTSWLAGYLLIKYCFSINPLSSDITFLHHMTHFELNCKIHHKKRKFWAFLSDIIFRSFGYERVYLPLYKVADTPFHINCEFNKIRPFPYILRGELLQKVKSQSDMWVNHLGLRGLIKNRYPSFPWNKNMLIVTYFHHSHIKYQKQETEHDKDKNKTRQEYQHPFTLVQSAENKVRRRKYLRNHREMFYYCWSSFIKK